MYNGMIVIWFKETNIARKKEKYNQNFFHDLTKSQWQCSCNKSEKILCNLHVDSFESRSDSNKTKYKRPVREFSIFFCGQLLVTWCRIQDSNEHQKTPFFISYIEDQKTCLEKKYLIWTRNGFDIYFILSCNLFGAAPTVLILPQQRHLLLKLPSI